MNSAVRIARETSAGLPLRRLCFPMGYPLEIATNSAEALSAAADIWDEFPPLSKTAPVRLQIEVSQCDALSEPVPVMPKHFEHLISIVQGIENFAIADMAAGFGVIHLSRDLIRDTSWFAYHFLEPIAYVLLGARHFTILHAACVALDGRAALLCGGSGVGKTSLAYACAKRGWSFVSGDAAHLVRGDPALTVVGRPFSIRFRSSAQSLFPELRRYRASLRPNGKRDLELDTRTLRVPICVQARAHIVVFLNRVAGMGKPVVENVPRDEARTILNESICFGDEQVRAAQRKALEHLLDRPLRRLTFADPVDAERVMRLMMAGAGQRALDE